MSLYAQTELGRALRLPEVRGVSDYRRIVPVSRYDLYQPYIERVLARNEAGVLTAERLAYVARSSGTTQGTKYVAYPPQLIAAFKRFEMRFAMHYMRESGNFALLDSEILITAGSPVCDVLPSGITVGYASGIMTLLAPRLARDVVRPTRDILEMGDWEAKVDATVRQAMALDIRLVTGIPLWAVAVLERLLAYARECGRDAPNARALWPNLAVYYWSGTSIGVHRARLRELLGPGVDFQEIYSATESPVAYQSSRDAPGLLVDIESSFLEFQPEGSPLDAPRIGVEDIEIGVRYRILMTTYGGLFAYALGDVVRFVSRSPLLLEVCGREREEMNIAGEKLGTAELREALERARVEVPCLMNNFFVTQADRAAPAKPTYHFYVDFERAPASVDAFLASVDRAMRSANGVYEGVRTGDDPMIGAPILTSLPTGTLQRYVHGTRAFGQSKFVQVYPERRGADEVLAALAGLAG